MTGSPGLSRIGSRLALVALVLAVALVPAGLARAADGSADGPTESECLAAWNESSASGRCPPTARSRQFWMQTTDDGQCKVTTRCATSDWLPSAFRTVTGSLDDMRDLDNCDGWLAVGCADVVQAASETVLQGRCENA